MLESLNTLHDRVNDLVSILLFETRMKRMFDDKKINTRQYAIITQVFSSPMPLQLKTLRESPWYLALYAKLTDKTARRDLIRLKELGLMAQNDKNVFFLKFYQNCKKRNKADFLIKGFCCFYISD